LVEIRLTPRDSTVAMDPIVARTLAATLLVVAERAESADTVQDQEGPTDG
jgi:hypothetical protein